MGDEVAARRFVEAERSNAFVAIAFEAVSVAGRARTGRLAGKFGRPDTNGLTVDAVDALRARAEQELPQGDDLRAAILSFATMYELHKFDAAAVVILGEGLEAAVHRVLNPAPAQRYRADIDG